MPILKLPWEHWPPEWPGFRLRMDGSIWTLVDIDDDGSLQFKSESDGPSEWSGSMAAQFLCFYDPMTKEAERAMRFFPLQQKRKRK